MRRLAVLLIAFFILAASPTSSARALLPIQADSGAIRGVVLDPQGAVVVGANIRATLNKTAEVYTAISGDDGSFLLGSLPFGDYSLLITAPGFAKFNTQVALSKNGSESPHNATLQVAMGEARINVHMILVGEGSNVCVVCGYTYFSFAYADLPLKNREPESLLALQPGVAGHHEGFSIGGRRLENKTSLLDSFDSRDPATGLSTVSLGIDSLAEFNSTYTNADTSVTSNYGQNSAPLLSSVSKAGTNQYHGQGFWHLNRTGLNANNFFTNRGRLTRDQAFFDQAGFTLGGTPSVPGVFSAQDRAFFFVSYEHTRDRERTGRQVIAPLESFVERTAGIHGPVFSGLLERNRIPLATDAGGLQDIDGDGLPDIGDAAVRESASRSRNLALGRFDFRLTDRFQVELIYASDKSRRLDDFNEFGFTPASPLGVYDRGDLAGFQFTAVINPSSINDFRLGYLRGRTALSGAGSDAPQLVALNTSLGVAGGVPEVPEQRDNRALIIADTFTRSAGTHTMRTGAQVIRRNQSYVSDALSQGRIYYSDALALITDGEISTGDPRFAIVRAELAQTPERSRYRFTDVYLFAHDDWRASPRFVLNYGLGYSLYSSAIYDAKTDRNNFAPFVSFAYAPTHSESFILRGGAAIIYVPPTHLPYGEITTTPLYPVSNGFAQPRELVGSLLPRSWAERDGALEIEPEFSADFRTAYTESTFFAIQQSIGDRLIIEVGYSGLFAHRLTRADRSDRSGIEFLSHAHNKSDEETILIASDGNSSYHSLQVRVTSRERRRLTFQAHYTLAKAIDTASGDRPSMFRSLALGPVNEGNAALERGPSDFDRRHRAVGFFQWRGPALDRLNRTGRVLLGDWRVSGIVTIQSGPGVSLYSGGDFSGGLGDFNRDGVLNDRIAYLGRGRLTGAIHQASPADGYFDSRLFGVPGENGQQMLGRNSLPAPGYGSIDLAVHKKISLTEAHAVEFRADVFNAANRANFAPPVTDFASADFGRSVVAGAARTLRLAVKCSF